VIARTPETDHLMKAALSSTAEFCHNVEPSNCQMRTRESAVLGKTTIFN
jgi:hypothetical protein